MRTTIPAAAAAAALAFAAPTLADTERIVPGAANAAGREGTYWKTFLQLTNPGSSDITVSVSFLPAGRDNAGAPEVAVVVPARRSLGVADVVGQLLGKAGGGALRLRSASPFHASSRTETAVAGSAPSGVEVPGEGSERAATRGVVFPLSNRLGKAGVRSNVGFVNPGSSPLVVTVRLLTGAGEELGSATVTLPPLGFTQLNDVFATFGRSDLDATAAELSYAAAAPVHAFGVVLENATGNGIYLAANPGVGPARSIALTPDGAARLVPDGVSKTGTFCRLNPLPGTSRLVLTFGTGDYAAVTGSAGPCPLNAGMGFSWKEISTDLTATGRGAMFRSYPGSCAAGDAASVPVGNDYYFLTGGPKGWTLSRYDLRTFVKLAEKDVALDLDRQASNDQMLAFVDGKLDASDLALPGDGLMADPYAGAGTFHKLFSLDLAPLSDYQTTEPSHVNGSSMVFVDGRYRLLTSTAFFGDLVALTYDPSFRLLDRKFLASRGQWSQGAVFDGETYWVAWVDVSRRGTANIVLGGFDRDFSPVARIDVTRFRPEDLLAGGRPSVIQQGDRLLVSYDVDGMKDAVSREESREWQCHVATYRIAKGGASNP